MCLYSDRRFFSFPTAKLSPLTPSSSCTHVSSVAVTEECGDFVANSLCISKCHVWQRLGLPDGVRFFDSELMLQ